METNEIMVNDEVVETTEEIAKASSGKYFKVAAGIGLAVVVGVIAYKYAAVPIMTKIKNKKEQQTINSDIEDIECDAYRIEDETEENED